MDISQTHTLKPPSLEEKGRSCMKTSDSSWAPLYSFGLLAAPLLAAHSTQVSPARR